MLTFDQRSPPELDPLTGWTLSADPLSQVRLNFPDLQSAIAFAERKGWRYEVREAPPVRATIRFDSGCAGFSRPALQPSTRVV